jgi:hypothetical protein
MSLALLNVDVGEQRWRRLAKNRGGGQTLGRVAAARTHGNLRGGEVRPAGGELRWTAEGSGSTHTRRICRRRAGWRRTGGMGHVWRGE